MNITELFNVELNNLIGKDIWGVVGGEGTGSVISLKIGEKTKKTKVSRNKNLSELVRNYDSQYGLMIYCPWRIESVDEILCGSHHNNDKSGLYKNAFDKILNSKIIDVSINKPSFDLRVTLNNGLSIMCFCASIGMDDNEYYSFKCPDGWYSVLFDGGLEFDSGV